MTYNIYDIVLRIFYHRMLNYHTYAHAARVSTLLLRVFDTLCRKVRRAYYYYNVQYIYVRRYIITTKYCNEKKKNLHKIWYIPQ